jgi:hypothetical protein
MLKLNFNLQIQNAFLVINPQTNRLCCLMLQPVDGEIIRKGDSTARIARYCSRSLSEIHYESLRDVVSCIYIIITIDYLIGFRCKMSTSRRNEL